MGTSGTGDSSFNINAVLTTACFGRVLHLWDGAGAFNMTEQIGWTNSGILHRLNNKSYTLKHSSERASNTTNKDDRVQIEASKYSKVGYWRLISLSWGIGSVSLIRMLFRKSTAYWTVRMWSGTDRTLKPHMIVWDTLSFENTLAVTVVSRRPIINRVQTTTRRESCAKRSIHLRGKRFR